ncbi:Male sterility protein [Nesidiocoris tenuis]|uniref:Fatty acyl-CoA reductase n=1 Tax=Nesidiocoris tenuis TaxID=355587 RepID=A0ABN7BFH8_9HEMI|nr:Male sterility protein [Nesidiocoris tenuis]
MLIPKYFEGKCVLITGATGFMGKALVEKLLRSCPNVCKIYVVIRTKKGQAPHERWAAITELPLFDELKSKRPEALKKVQPIPGESTIDHFGISEEHRKELIENVNIIYHVAASIRFTEDLPSAVLLNVKSTYTMLEMAKQMKQFECFVHVSTAYSNIEKVGQEIKEQVYDAHLDWRDMLRLSEDPVTADLLPSLQSKIMNGHANTYTLTKRLSEDTVREYSQYFPVVIMRPALVIATTEDPFPGWLDGHNALTQFADSVRCGLVRVVNTDPTKSIQLISLDLSIKAFLIATWNVHRKGMKSGVDVYCTSLGDANEGVCLSWGLLQKHGVEIAADLPAERQLWHPFCLLIRNPILLAVAFFFLQVIPAILLDIRAKIRGDNSKFLRLTARLYKALTGPLHDFSGMDFKFSRVNYKSLDGLLNQEDRPAFSIDQTNIDPIELYKLNAYGMVKYAVGEDFAPDALQKRKKRYAM